METEGLAVLFEADWIRGLVLNSEEGWRGRLNDAVVSNMNCSFGHSGEDVIFHVKISTCENINTEAGNNKA